MFLLQNLAYSINVWAEETVLLLGDSLSAGYGLQQQQSWVYLLNKSLTEENAHYKIINASISGETTGGGLSRLPAILAKNNVDYLLIELGGNDGLRGFSPKIIKNNLLQIIQLAKAKNISVFLMQIQIPPNYGVRYNKMFEQVFSQVAAQENVELLPFFMKDIAIKADLMQKDGIHPNAKAQPLIVDFMKKSLAEHIK